MKKTVMIVAAMAALIGFAGQDDLLVTLKVNEKLAYADKTTVVNDRVALVWTPSGVTFGGFYADGSLVDGRSKPLAFINVTDGNVGTVSFQISAALAETMKLAGGSYALYLLDTRGADNKPVVATGSSNNEVVAVNYYAKLVSSDGQGANEIGGTSSAASAGTSADTIVAEGRAELPLLETELQPIIKSVKIEDGKFKVTIENPVPYLKYGVLSGETPDAVTTSVGEAVTPKPQTETMTVEVPADKPSGFIKVNAERNK